MGDEISTFNLDLFEVRNILYNYILYSMIKDPTLKTLN